MATAGLFAGVSGLFAHDYLQGNTAAQVEREVLVMRTTLARSAARALLDNPPQISINEETFTGTFSGLLTQKAGELFTVTSNGQTLAPRAASVHLTEELDVEFEVAYPRPADGSLEFQAIYIKRMDAGHMNRIDLLVDRKFVEWVDLDIEKDTFKTVFPPPRPSSIPAVPLAPGTPMPAPGMQIAPSVSEAPPVAASPPAGSASAPPSPTPPTAPVPAVAVQTAATPAVENRPWLWAACILASIILAALATARSRRQHSQPGPK